MLKKFKRAGRPHYYLRGTVAGVRVYESTGLSSASAADAYRLRREQEIIKRHSLGRAATLTFAEAALGYMETGGEARFLLPILDHLGPEYLLSDVTNDTATEVARAVYPDAKPSTINRQVITPISAVFNFISMETGTPPRRFRKHRVNDKRLRWLTPAEAERLIAAADPHLVPVLGFLLGGGCRVGEAIAITPQLFYPRTREAYVAEAKNGDPRMITLPPRAVDMILGAGLPEVGPICRTPKGKAYAQRTNGGGQISGAFRKAATAAGLGPDVVPHTLRHTWATWYYAQTKDFGGLLDRGGWRRPDMAMRYRKVAPSDTGEELRAHGWDFSDNPAPTVGLAPPVRLVRSD